jgi:curved DNA-binding protein CbpA
MAQDGAAVAAAQILAFSKEPLRHRPRLTQGRETFPGGLHVFRLAQGRFPPGLLRELSVAERERLRQAAAFFIRQVCLWEGATHYQVLCVSPDARRETIKEHYHGLMALIHPDRQDASSESWPSHSAQRVNQAYAVLSDEAQRRTYDATLRKSAARPAVVEESVERTHYAVTMYANLKERILATRRRFRRQLLPVAAVLAAMFFIEMWWTADSVEGLSSLGADSSFEQYYQWTRDVFSGGGLPKFLGTGEPRPAGQSAAGDAGARAEPESFLNRIAKVFTNTEPKVVAAPVRAPEIAAAIPAESRPAVPEPTRRVSIERSAVVGAAAPRPPDLPVESSERVPAANAQAPVRQAATDTVLDPHDMEMLMVRVVSYYEAGDVDRLLALYDVGSVSVWEAMRLRRDFLDFFRATKTRTLHVRRISWDTSALPIRARGDATLVADYRDEPGRVERIVGLELDVVERDGQARLARLSLFPHE